MSNSIHDPETGQVDQQWLDRLVDGELNSAEWKAVVRSLDREPDGWRRCAAAFLEAQAWQLDFQASVHDAPLSNADGLPTNEPPTDLASPSGGWDQPGSQRGSFSAAAGRLGRSASDSPVPAWAWLLAVAASGLLAFVLGNASANRRPKLVQQTEPALVVGETDDLPSERPPGTPESQASGDERGRQDDGNGDTRWANAATIPPEIQPVGNLNLQVDDVAGRGGGSVSVPVYDWQQGGARLLSEPTEMPPQLIDAVHRMGGRVERQRGVLPVSLDNGQQILVPIEQLEIVPITERRFQ